MTQRRTYAEQRIALLALRWIHALSCYQITAAYLLLALVAIALLAHFA